MDCSVPSFPVLHFSPKFAQTLIHWVHDAIQPSRPLLPSFPPTLNLSQHQGLFEWVSSLHHVAKVLGFSFRISPSNEYSGLISFRIDWFDFPAVQEILKSLLQHHNSKAIIFWHSAFFMVQLSHLYMTPVKTYILAYIQANMFYQLEVEGSWLLRGKASFVALYKFISVILFFFLPSPLNWL